VGQTANYVEGDWQFSSPYGLVRPVDQIGIIARRMMVEAGVKREHFGAAAVAVRKHAEQNPMARMRKPLTMAEYLAARMIADPMCLFDCCLESDGSLACVITSAERARDLRQKPAYIHAAAQGMGPNASIMTNYYKRDFLSTANSYVARDLWRRSDIQAADLRCAQLYDAFTPLILVSLEEFGFVKPGEAGDFALDGNLEWPNGRLPTNTSGGSLSEAYVHGFNLICEGVRQIRGTSINQVRDCESVLVTSGAGVPNGAVLLRLSSDDEDSTAEMRFEQRGVTSDSRCEISASPRPVRKSGKKMCEYAKPPRTPMPTPRPTGGGEETRAAHAALRRLRGDPLPPRPCPVCNSQRDEWVPMSGTGTIYGSWIVVHPPVLPAFTADAPLTVVLVQLDDNPTCAWSAPFPTSPTRTAARHPRGSLVR
jgi:hypothetical protein